MGGLTVIVLSKNDSNLKECLRAVHELEPGLRTFIVDDGLKGDWSLGHWVLRGEKPFCFARNANLAIKCVGRDDAILLNDDATLETPGGFRAMQRAAEEHPEFGVISAATNVAYHQAQRSCQYPSPPKEVPPAPPYVRDAGAGVSFVCVLIPCRTIERVGLLDERFCGEIDGEMVYGGEEEYSYRCRLAGFKIGVFDGCYVDHARLPSTFRPHGGGLPINATRKRFKEIHGVEMEL